MKPQSIIFQLCLWHGEDLKGHTRVATAGEHDNMCMRCKCERLTKLKGMSQLNFLKMPLIFCSCKNFKMIVIVWLKVNSMVK